MDTLYNDGIVGVIELLDDVLQLSLHQPTLEFVALDDTLVLTQYLFSIQIFS